MIDNFKMPIAKKNQMKFDWMMVIKKGKLNLKFIKVKGMQMRAHAFL